MPHYNASTRLVLNPPIKEALAATSNLDENRSRRIGNVCARYLEACRQHRPALADKQWLFICDVLNGHISQPVETLPHYTASLWDSLMGGTHRKWGMDDDAAKSLICRLENQSFAEAMAVIEVVDRFWSQDDTLPAEAALKLAMER